MLHLDKRVVRFAMSIGAVILSLYHNLHAQDASIAQQWNEQNLTAITRDFARPTVHARNLFHMSIAMYDAWAAYEPTAEPYLLGRTRGSYTSPFNGVALPADPEEVEAAREIAISYASFRLLRHRYLSSPNAFLTQVTLNQKMAELGLETSNTSTDYLNGGPAELGNYIAQQIINFGFTDGANESANYANQIYEPVNPNILPEQTGTNGIVDPNRWQAISLSVAIDQSGNAVSDPPHLSPEWGNVLPYAMTDANKSVLERDGHNWNVYYDPGPPPFLDTTDASGIESLYKWNFCMVNIWQSHLDPNDETLIDISPASIGNIDVSTYPQSQEDYPAFYNLNEGGVVGSNGHELNPFTGSPYEPQFVKRGDYGRILAEFWADGLDSETPPGHWYKIYNEIRHYPDWENKWQGVGPELNNLEMDVKSYLTIGGGMHDAAISAWSIKGYYDYVRPVSAVRYMCEKGQCSDAEAPNFHPAGMPLIPGLVEQVTEGDPLAGPNNEHVGKIKLYTWKGPDYIDNPETDYAGVGWIMGTEFWPYQRPSFVTPPFSGFISGHSTFSSAAAEIFTRITGSPYFPGGMGVFHAEQNEFLEFEIGPSESLTLQWATYRDASDECSLSRIWGGIHPPADDIPGRLIGLDLGNQVFDYTQTIFDTDRPQVSNVLTSKEVINIEEIGETFTATITFDRDMDMDVVPGITFLVNDPLLQQAVSVTDVGWSSATTYDIEYLVEESTLELHDIFMRITGATDASGMVQNVYLKARPFTLDTRRPELESATASAEVLNDATAAGEGLTLSLVFDEACDTSLMPEITITADEDLEGTLLYDAVASHWVNDTTFMAVYDLADNNEELDGIVILVDLVFDEAGNLMASTNLGELFSIDTRNPIINELTISNDLLNAASVGSEALSLTFTFDEAMDTGLTPSLAFPNDNPLGSVLVFNPFSSGWADVFTYTAVYNQVSSQVEFFEIDIELNQFADMAGNAPAQTLWEGLFAIDTKAPEVSAVSPSEVLLSDAEASLGIFEVEVNFTEPMNQDQLLLMQLSGPNGIAPSMAYNPFLSSWTDANTYAATFNVSDQNVELEDIQLLVSFGADEAGNAQLPFTQAAWLQIDTRNPELAVLMANVYTIGPDHIGVGGFHMIAMFDEAMDQSATPQFVFSGEGLPEDFLAFNTTLSGWQNHFTYHAHYDVAAQTATAPSVAVSIEGALDMAGNDVIEAAYQSFLAINIETLSTSETGIAGMQLYPNPIQSGTPLMIAVGEQDHNVDLRITSMGGKLVSQVRIPHLPPGTTQHTLPSLSAGVYFVQLMSDRGQSTVKLLVME